MARSSKTASIFTLGILSGVLRMSGGTATGIEWPTISDVSAVVNYGRSFHWDSDQRRNCLFDAGNRNIPKAIIEIDPLDVEVGKSFVLLNIQDDDDLWRAVIIKFDATSDLDLPIQWTVADTILPEIKHVTFHPSFRSPPQPRFSTDFSAAGGRLQIEGFDGRGHTVGGFTQGGRVQPGKHSFLLEWDRLEAGYEYEASQWLEVNFQSGHYRLGVKRVRDALLFLATNESAHAVVATSKAIPIEKHIPFEIKILPHEGPTLTSGPASTLPAAHHP